MRYDVFDAITGMVIYSTDALASVLAGQLRAGEAVGLHGAPEPMQPQEWQQLVQQELALLDSRLTRLAFRNRFAQGEKVALELASLDEPSAPMPQRQQAAALRAYLADVAAATYVDLARPDTRAGVQALESWGLLATGRAAQILDAPVQPEERPL